MWYLPQRKLWFIRKFHPSGQKTHNLQGGVVNLHWNCCEASNDQKQHIWSSASQWSNHWHDKTLRVWGRGHLNKTMASWWQNSNLQSFATTKKNKSSTRSNTVKPVSIPIMYARNYIIVLKTLGLILFAAWDAIFWQMLGVEEVLNQFWPWSYSCDRSHEPTIA